MQPFHAPLAVNAQAGSTAGRGSGGLAASAGRRREAAEQSGPRGRGRGLRLWLSAELQLHAVLETVRAVRRQGRWAVAGRLALQVRLRLLHLREVEPLRAVPHDLELRHRPAVPDRVVKDELAIVLPVLLAASHAVVDPEGEARVRVERHLVPPGRGVNIDHSNLVVFLDHLMTARTCHPTVRFPEDHGRVVRGKVLETASNVRDANTVRDQSCVARAIHAADVLCKLIEDVLPKYTIANGLPTLDAEGHGARDNVFLHQLEIILFRPVGDPVQPGAFLSASRVPISGEGWRRGCCICAAHTRQRPKRKRKYHTEHGGRHNLGSKGRSRLQSPPKPFETKRLEPKWLRT
mmetsp:Transcript_64031/g.206270  ORF Transcript_64031/g.206270 Transcript_64031/m.206270 type:complete len:349 (-) Transcript_64031:3-1049(-)